MKMAAIDQRIGWVINGWRITTLDRGHDWRHSCCAQLVLVIEKNDKAFISILCTGCGWEHPVDVTEAAVDAVRRLEDGGEVVRRYNQEYKQHEAVGD